MVKINLLKNGIYNTAGGVIRLGLGILIIPIMIRQLGVEEYGLWTLASTVIVVVMLAQAGLSTSTTVFVAQNLGDQDIEGLSVTLTVIIGTMLIIATLVAIILWVWAPQVVGCFPNLTPFQLEQASKALQIGALAVWARLLQEILVGIEQGIQRYDLTNFITTIQSFFTNIGMGLIVFSGGKTVELMEWQTLINVLMLGTNIIFVRGLLKNMPIHLSWNYEEAVKIGKYSSMVWVTSLGGILFSRIDRLVVGRFLGTQALGVYSSITDVTTQINALSALPIQPLVSHLGQLSQYNTTENTMLRDTVKKAVETNAFVACGLGGSLIMLAPLLVKLIFPNELNQDYTLILQITTLIYCCYSLNAVGYYVLLGVKEAKISSMIQLGSATASLLFITIGAYTFGLMGAVIGNSIYLISHGFTFFAMNILKIPLQLWMDWIYFPIGWFIVVAVSGFLVPLPLMERIILVVLQNLILLGWFIFNYRLKPSVN
jgi:O-antigen/teichoic acid export membrane protein